MFPRMTWKCTWHSLFVNPPSGIVRLCHVAATCHNHIAYNPPFTLILGLRWHRYDLDTCHHIFDRTVHINRSSQCAASSRPVARGVRGARRAAGS
eukprot:1195816-Prorocentrum_minimum.AAC.6